MIIVAEVFFLCLGQIIFNGCNHGLSDISADIFNRTLVGVDALGRFGGFENVFRIEIFENFIIQIIDLQLVVCVSWSDVFDRL